jgi:transcriptional regulator with XRE-family HTH domain
VLRLAQAGAGFGFRDLPGFEADALRKSAEGTGLRRSLPRRSSLRALHAIRADPAPFARAALEPAHAHPPAEGAAAKQTPMRAGVSCPLLLEASRLIQNAVADLRCRSCPSSGRDLIRQPARARKSLDRCEDEVGRWLSLLRFALVARHGDQHVDSAVRLGQRLRRARGSLSQRELAKHIGASAAYLSRIERGERVPSLQLLERIADALGVDLDWLRGRSSSTGGQKSRAINPAIAVELDAIEAALARIRAHMRSRE